MKVVLFFSHTRFWRGAMLTLGCLFFFGLTHSAAKQDRQLPDGPGKAELQKLCSQCHELEKSYSLKQDRAGWQTTIDKMAAAGMKASDEELLAVLEYLVKNYAADEVPKIKVNQATAIELESGLSVKRSQAAVIIAYREKNGKFKSIEDLKKVPGIEAEKIEAKKDRLLFDE